MFHFFRTPTPEPPKEEDAEPEEGDGATKNEENGEASENNGDKEEDGPEPPKKPKKDPDVYKLPAFQPLEMGKNGKEKCLRIPKTDKPEVSSSLAINKTGAPSAADLTDGHLKHWAEVKKNWKRAYAENEKRYGESLKVLERIYKT